MTKKQSSEPNEEMGATTMEIVYFQPIHEVAHAIFEDADPRLGCPGFWEEEIDPHKDERGWHDLTDEQQEWFEELIRDCIFAAFSSEEKNVQSSTTHVALLRPSKT